MLVLLLSVPVDRGPLAAPPMASSAAGATLPGEPPASALAGADLVPELVPYAGPEPSAAAAPAATRRPGVAADSLAFGYREWRHSLERGLAGHDFAAGSHDGAAARSGALAGRPEPAAWQDHFGEMARLSGLLAGIVREGRPHGLDARFRR